MKIYGDNGIKIDLPSGGGIEDVTVGGVSVVEDNVAVIPEIPTKTSDLTNDSGFITSSSLPTKVSDLQNDLGFITQTALANYVKNTDFATTDVGGVVKASDTTKFYVNASGTPMADIIQYQNWASTSDYAFVGKKTLDNVLTAKAYITENDIPSNVSYFTNDAGYITASDIPDPSVGDVLINGTSIVDSDGDADIPVADGNGYGVIKGLSGAGYVADDGALYASTLTAANYGTAQNYLFVSKGTLENVLASKGYALSSDIPTKTSDLTNDSGFITSSDIPSIPSKTSDLTNDSGFITSSSLPTKVSDLTNDTGFITASDVKVKDAKRGSTSIVDNAGVINFHTSSFTYENGQFYINDPSQDLIKNASTSFKPLTVKTTHYATFYGLAKAAGVEETGSTVGSYSAASLAAIQSMLGITSGGGAVDDVQINGTSIVDENGVANLKPNYGIKLYSNGYLGVTDASVTNISRRDYWTVLTANRLDIAVKAALCDGVGEDWTSTEQAAARERLGITSGGGAVDDVQINGTSIVDENGVANIPAATPSSLGVVKTDSVYGTAILGTGVLALSGPTTAQIDSRSIGGKPILLGKLDYAVKAALCDGVGAAWSSTEQAAARTRLGVDYPVKDVTVLGTSVIDENGVADIGQARYATAGVIKASETYKFYVDYTGVPSADIVQYSNWSSTNNYAFVSKGTLNNVLAAKGYITEDDTPSATFYGLAKAAGVEETGSTVGSYSAASLAAIQNMLGISGGGAVDDVQMNGTSIVDENGVANIPLSENFSFGLVKLRSNYGISYSSTHGYFIEAASQSSIKNRDQARVLKCNNIDSAVKAALTDGVGAAWSSTEQAAAQQRLGISGGSSDPTAYSPSGSANDAANIQTILNTYKSCRLAPGTYLLESEIAMYDDYCLMGSGPSTVLTFSSGSGERALLKFCYAPSGSVADDRGGITVKDLTLRGAETISDSYITSSSSVGNDNGIRTVSDDTSIGVYRSPNKVQNVIFEKFTGYCVKQGASAYTNVDYTFGTTGRYTTNRIDFNGCTFRSSHGGYYDPGHSYTTGIAFVDCLFNFLYLGIKIGGMGVDGVNTKFTEIYGQILLCQTAEYYPYLENSFTGCYFDGTHCSETADIRINPYGDPNFRTVFTSCIFIANKGYIYNGTVSCCNCRFVNSKQTYSGYVKMELEGTDAITSFICCSSDAVFDTWGQAYSGGKCKFVGCYKDDGTEIK